MRVVISVVVILLLWIVGRNGIVFMSVCLLLQICPFIFNRQFSSCIYNCAVVSIDHV
jgi:hypothetical protein